MKEPIASYKKTREIIEKNSFLVKKSLGQNFLIDPHVLDKILDAAAVTAEDSIIEIGPGIGGLTQALAERAYHVTAVEIDKELIGILKENLRSYDNVRIIHGDILKTDKSMLLPEPGRPAKVVANLPYYITTPIIMEVLEKRWPVESLTVMVQKEVGDRMRAKPGSKDYGALTLAVQYYAKVYLAANVPPNCFIPRPTVGSAVIHLQISKEQAVSVKNEALMFEIIRAAFSQRRKTLVNCLHHHFKMEKNHAEALLESCGLNAMVRGEALCLEDFARLADSAHPSVIPQA